MANTNIDNDIAIALVATILNFMLSLIIPPFLKNTKLPIITQIKQNYECNRNILFISSCIVFIFVYVSLKITPWVQENVFTIIGRLSNTNKVIIPMSSSMSSPMTPPMTQQMPSPNDLTAMRYKYFSL
jgi:hypothetical protein